MEERTAIYGVLLIGAISVASYLVISSGALGAVTSQSYVACCCNILAEEGYGAQKEQAVVRSQIQTYAGNCKQACQYYADQGTVFAQEGYCALNP